MTQYEIRLATTEDDRNAAYRLRYELYVEEQGLFEDVADHDRRHLSDEMDEHADITIGIADGEVVGTGRSVRGGGDRIDRESRETFDVGAFADLLDEDALGPRCHLDLHDRRRWRAGAGEPRDRARAALADA